MSQGHDAAVLLRAVCDGVLTLTLNRPEHANTLSNALMDALENEIVSAGGDDGVCVVVITANGKIFCAGHDLAQMQEQNSGADSGAYFEVLFARCSRLMGAIRQLNKPVVAKVQGAAVAAGCQLVAACDLAYAADHAKFGVNGINLGLFCSTPSVALSRAVLPKQALELLMTGELIRADKAAGIGLINAAVPAGELDALVEGKVRSIASKIPSAIALGKDLFYRQLGLEEKAAYELAGACMARNIGFDETRRLINGFLEGAR